MMCMYDLGRLCSDILTIVSAPIRPLTRCLLMHASRRRTSYIVDSVLISLNLDFSFTLHLLTNLQSFQV